MSFFEIVFQCKDAQNQKKKKKIQKQSTKIKEKKSIPVHRLTKTARKQKMPTSSNSASSLMLI